MTLSNLIFILLIWISNNTDYKISKFDYSVNIEDKKTIEIKACNEEYKFLHILKKVREYLLLKETLKILVINRLFFTK